MKRGEVRKTATARRCLNVGSISYVSDVLSGHSRLTSMQAVQQVKSSDSDLEAERGKEKRTGLVQDQPNERPLLAVWEGTAAEETQRQRIIVQCNR